MHEPIYTPTTRYDGMIKAFNADFELAVGGDNILSNLDDMIAEEHTGLMRDINLMGELEFGLRHGTLKIVEVN